MNDSLAIQAKDAYKMRYNDLSMDVLTLNYQNKLPK